VFLTEVGVESSGTKRNVVVLGVTVNILFPNDSITDSERRF
jgi:hypothetical protein